jgi:hypothetical protein
VREGIQLYQAMLDARKLPATESPYKLVAKAIYGKSESDIREMMDRLSMIDEYLEAIEQPGAYDRVGQRSEDFLEACKVMTAAENRQLDPQFLAKLKLGLFYLIDQDQMDNWQIRKIYQSLGGDPRKKGRKPRENTPALQELLETLPDPAAIQEELVRIRQPEAPEGAPDKPPIDPVRVEAGVERFLRRTSDRAKPLSAVAEGAQADIEELEKALAERKRREALGEAERDSIALAIESMAAGLKKCKLHLKKIHPVLPFREEARRGQRQELSEEDPQSVVRAARLHGTGRAGEPPAPRTMHRGDATPDVHHHPHDDGFAVGWQTSDTDAAEVPPRAARQRSAPYRGPAGVAVAPSQRVRDAAPRPRCSTASASPTTSTTVWWTSATPVGRKRSDPSPPRGHRP